MNKFLLRVWAFGFALAVSLGSSGCQTGTGAGTDELVGAWRGKVQFKTGAFAAVTDLEFMYTFNAGGTMNESSNYDGVPPVPPAYGVWAKVGAKTYQAKYAYYWTKPPANLDEITKGGGWAPGGHGVLTQKITLAEDGNTFTADLQYEVFDPQGKPTEGGSTAVATAARIRL